ncbi:MAG: FecR family protein [Polyangiaceae bacterium]
MKDMRAAAYVQPPLAEQRLDRQWDNISSRLERRPRTGLALGLTGAVAMAAAMIVVFGLRRAPAQGEAFVVASLTEGMQELTFQDGSRVTVAPGGRLRVDHATKTDVAMHLEAGRARFEVKHDESRRFAVAVADLEVVDRGTRFEITRGDEARPGVDVRVEEGEVELAGAGHAPRRIAAGESWSNRSPEKAQTAQLPVAPPSSALHASSSNNEAPRAEAPNADSEAVTQESAVRSRGRGKGGESARGLETRAARELFELGNAAKIEGRLRDAADAFDALRLRHRSDGHAALAALELGRLRLNHFNDAAGALAALEDAVKLAPRASFREEAEARIVDALAALGRDADCVRARDQFAQRHPRSVHAASVAGKCGAR